MRAVTVDEFGSLDNLTLAEVPEPRPADDQVLVRVGMAGVNLSDRHVVEGTYVYRPPLPYVPGVEAIGTDPAGQRVLALTPGGGSWAELVAAPTLSTLPVPDFVTDQQALALATQGFTAWHLLRTCARLTQQDSVAIFAAAGGVGTVAVQLAKAWGARRVVAVASTEDKRRLALSLGADAAVASDAGDLTSALKHANEGRAVDVVLEMTGGATLDAALASLARHGRLVVYGNASGEKSTPIRPEVLMQGSRTVTGFLTNDFVVRRPRIAAETMNGLWGMVRKGDLRPVTEHTFALGDAAKALHLMAARQTVGKVLLDVTA